MHVLAEWPSYLWLFLFFSVNLILFLTAFYSYYNSSTHYNNWVPVARGAGATLNFNCAMIVLPMCRRVLGYLRATWLVNIIPFDAAIEFHKLVAWFILLGTVVHTVAHFGNYSTLPDSFASSLFNTNAGLTGFVLLLIMAVMYLGASELVRRGTGVGFLGKLSTHAVFFCTHHLFVVFFALLLIHGLNYLNPNFWKWFIVPGAIYALERAYREFWLKRELLPIVKAVPLAGGVTALCITKPAVHWHARPGQYLFLQVSVWACHRGLFGCATRSKHSLR